MLSAQDKIDIQASAAEYRKQLDGERAARLVPYENDYNDLALDSDPIIAAAQKALLDKILTLMERDRYRIQYKSQESYPKDYVIRMMEAMVARAAYRNRVEWSHIEQQVRKDLDIHG